MLIFRRALPLLLLPLFVHAAAAKVWPTKARRLPDGRVELSYDLRPVKAGKVPLDLGEGADDAALAAFLKALPPDVRTVVNLDEAALTLDAVGGLEQAPLSPSFSRVDDGLFEGGSDDVPALHPDAPKVLPSVDLVLWRARAQMERAEIAFAVAAHEGKAGLPMGRRALCERLLKISLQRYRHSTGTVRDGAKRLAARLAGTIAAVDGRLPDAVRNEKAIAAAAEEELSSLLRPAPQFPPSPLFSWRQDLRALQVWDRALSEPFAADREGTAAALTFLAILQQDAKLQQAYAALLAYRDSVFGRPRVDGFDRFREALGEGTAQEALEDMASFLARLPAAGEQSVGPIPFARAQTPVARFVAQLSGPEALNAVEELTLATQEGRVSFVTDSAAGWSLSRDAFVGALVRPEADGNGRLDAPPNYRDRTARTFQALHGLAAEVRGGERTEISEKDAGTPGPKLRLMVPPHLELEPLPATYQEAAGAWRRLAEVAAPHAKQAALRPIGKEAQQEARLLHGLSLLAKEQLGEQLPPSDADQAALKVARRFVAGWRSDATLRQDVRFLLPLFKSPDDGTYVHSGVFGVGRREVEVSFEKPPKIEVVTSRPEHAALFEAEPGLQRYQVPVLATGSVSVPRAAPLDAEGFRSACDKAGRLRDGIEAALPDTLVRTLSRVEE